MTSRRTRPRRLLLPATVVALALCAAGCGDGGGGGAATGSAEVQGSTTSGPAEPVGGLDAGLAAAVEWADRPVAQILADGFDTEACRAEATGADGDAAWVGGLGWAFLSLPLEITERERLGELLPVVELTGDEVFDGPELGYTPTHAWIHELDRPMLDALAAAGGTDDLDGVEVVLGLDPTDQGRNGTEPVRLAFASFAWLLVDGEVIPFNPDCFWPLSFLREIGEPHEELPGIRTDPLRRAEIAGLTADLFDPTRCLNLEPELSTLRVGFGGSDVGLAFGPWPADAGTFADIEIADWTVLPPVDEDPPTFLESRGQGFPRGVGLDPDGWLLTYTMTDGRPVVHTIFHADPVVGLHIWSDVEPRIGSGPCFDARQLIAFREFVDDTVPDRPAWDLTPVVEGSEAIIMDTITLLRTDEAARARFHEWTPCTYKLCEFDGTVDR
jgi:hypothetical protein